VTPGGAFTDQVKRAQRQLIKLEGPRAAAWLVWIARAKLHRAGAVDYHFRPGEKEPRYFLFAIAALKLRPRTWLVELRPVVDGGKDYRVTWRTFHTHGVRWEVEAALAKQERGRRARNARKLAEKEWRR
jgi:hypothetical protein